MSWPSIELRELVVAHYGKSLKKEVRDDSGNVKVFGSSGLVGSHSSSICDYSTIIVGRKGSVGKIIWAPEGGWIIDTAYYLERKSKYEIDLRYLYYALIKADLAKRTITTSIPGLNRDDFYETKIPLPYPDDPEKSLKEQKRIAAILDKADGIRRKRKQAIQLADDFLRSVFLDMFGDPVTNPKGWEVKAFGDLGKWASGGTPSRANSDYFEGDINWYSARELNHRYLAGSVEKITETALKESAAKVFPENSMLVGMYDTAAFKISILREPSASNQACANLIPNDLVDIEWFYSFIEFSKETYLRQRRGVRQKNLNLGMIKEFELPLPPIDTQRKFKKVAEKLLSSKALQVKSLKSSDGNFNSLSQKAFKGEL